MKLRRFCHLKEGVSKKKHKSTLIADVDGEKRMLYYFDSGPPLKSAGEDKNLPPLLLLPGTCQTVTTWMPHVEDLSRDRRLLIPEMRCSGKNTKLLASFDSLYTFVEDLENYLFEIDESFVDIVGFSLGGRIALAFAAHKKNMVRKLSLTGVPLQRSALGELILEGWRSGLVSDSAFKSTAWAFVLNGFSDEYLKQNSRYINHYVERVYENNQRNNIHALLSQSHAPNDKAAAINCAHLISCPTQIISAGADRISDLKQEKLLANRIKASHHTVINGSGHLLPFEHPKLWREHVQSFMNS